VANFIVAFHEDGNTVGAKFRAAVKALSNQHVTEIVQSLDWDSPAGEKSIKYFREKYKFGTKEISSLKAGRPVAHFSYRDLLSGSVFKKNPLTDEEIDQIVDELLERLCNCIRCCRCWPCRPWPLCNCCYKLGLVRVYPKNGIATSSVITNKIRFSGGASVSENINHEALVRIGTVAGGIVLGTTHADAAYGDHSHAGLYEPAFTKNSAFNKNFGTSHTEVAFGDHGHTGYATSGDINTAVSGHTHNISDDVTPTANAFDRKNIKFAGATVSSLDANTALVSGYEPAFTKNTGFNKDFGTTHTTVAYGDHTHGGYAASGHNHDTVYAPIVHTHSGYAATGHVHTFGTISGTYAEGNHNHDSSYYTETEVDTTMTNHCAATSAAHDGRYFTETEVSAMFRNVDDTEASAGNRKSYSKAAIDAQFAPRIINGSKVNPSRNGTKAVIPLSVPDAALLARIVAAGARIVLSGFAFDYGNTAAMFSVNLTFGTDAAINGNNVEVTITEGANTYDPGSAPWDSRCTFVTAVVTI